MASVTGVRLVAGFGGVCCARPAAAARETSGRPRMVDLRNCCFVTGYLPCAGALVGGSEVELGGILSRRLAACQCRTLRFHPVAAHHLSLLRAGKLSMPDNPDDLESQSA